MSDRYCQPGCLFKRRIAFTLTRIPNAKPRRDVNQATVRRKRTGAGAHNRWRDVGVGLLRESRERPLHTGRLRGPDQALHRGESLAGCLESGNGSGGKPRFHGGSHAGRDGDLSRHPARTRFADSTHRICSLPIPRKPLDLGVGHRVDMGTAGSGARIAWARYRTRRPEMGR
jgi:hypothetical protein